MRNEEHTKICERIPELDAVRGIACLVVSFVHLWSIISFYLPDSYMYAFYGIGKFAVSIFFILSAYLSTKQAINGIIPGKFLVKRFVRIYVPFACAAIFGWLIDWINTKEDLISLLDLTNVTGHFWTIAVQLKFYFVFSILTSIVYYFNLRKKIVILGLVSVSFILMFLFPQNAWTINAQGLQWYFIIFAIGSIIAMIEEYINISNKLKLLFDILFMLFFAVILLRIPILRYVFFKVLMDDSLLKQYLVQGIAAGILLFLLLQGRWIRGLLKRMRVVQLVGNANYSIYLIHYIIFSKISELDIGFMYCIVLSIVITGVLSAIWYLYIERKLTSKCLLLLMQGRTLKLNTPQNSV